MNDLKTNIFGGGNHVGANPPGSRVPILRKSAIEMADTSPTRRLDNDPLAFSSIQYPKDLTDNNANGHYMLFYINVQNKTRYSYTGYDKEGNKIKVGGKKIYTEPNDIYKQGKLESAAGTEYIVNGATQRPDYADNLATINKQTFDRSDTVDLSKSKRQARTGLRSLDFANTTTRITDSIAIYLPPQVQDNLTQSYNTTETGLLGFLAASGGKFAEAMKNNDYTGAGKVLLGTSEGALMESLKRVGGAIAETVTQSEGGYEMLNQVFGRAMNPYMEVLYGGPQLRTFTYNFSFMPKNRDERDDVQKIIQMFRFHSAPEMRTDHNMFLGLPSEFDIHYCYQNNDGIARENSYYNKIATCVLQSVNTDYTPGEVRSHQDGSPVKITMSLSFLETEMITKQHIDEGF